MIFVIVVDKSRGFSVVVTSIESLLALKKNTNLYHLHYEEQSIFNGCWNSY